MSTEAYLEPSRTSTIELFFALVKTNLKNMLNSIELPLKVPFFAQLILLWKSLELGKKVGKKSLLLTTEQFLFQIQNYAMEWLHE